MSSFDKTWWDKHCEFSTFIDWVGEKNNPSKVKIRDYIYNQYHRTVLDCGAGLCSDWKGFVEEYPAIHYNAIDFTEKFVKVDKEMGIDITRASVEAIPKEDKDYDVVYCRHLLEHLSSFETALLEMIRVARRETIVTFFLPPEEEAIMYVDKDGLNTNVYCRDDIEELLRNHDRVVKWRWEEFQDEEILYIQLYYDDKVFCYWEGPKPDWISMLEEIATAKLDNKLIKLTPDNVKDWLELPDQYYKITKPNHKTDYLKGKLIQKYGGWWMDMDTLIIDDITKWSSLFRSHDYIGTPGLFGAPKGSVTINNWVKAMTNIVIDHQDFHWAELINPLITRPEYDPFAVLQPSEFCPFWYEGEKLHQLYSNDEPNKYITRDTKAVILFNSIFEEDWKRQTKEQILCDTRLLSKLIKKYYENT